ncbi:MAG: phosphatase PAP2 family protein, partial [Acidimicrobiia bacterium]|nr:phosphatase PAP2 family protein [Acidimicrobiia bacterium]
TRLLDNQPRRAGTVALAGTAAWLVCKPLKRLTSRPRPDANETAVKTRGAAQTGLGYPSGHAAVATAMGTVLAKGASRSRLGGIALVAGTVGASRVYIGAHYPLDVAGGWAAGIATATLVRSLGR